MENMKYNIVWADDEIFSICDKFTKNRFDKNAIDIIQCFTNAKSLKEYLDTTDERIDAVVVDANFPYEEFTSNQENSTIGLQKVAQWIENYDKKYPFIVYTGRKNLMDTEEGKALFEFFYENKRIVTKSGEGISQLIAKIKELVDQRNTIEWVIENQYSSAMKSAAMFDYLGEAKSKQLLLEILTKNHQNTLCDTENYFNRIRCEVLDNMNTMAGKFGIVPEGLSLNNFGLFLCKANKDYEYSEKDVLPDALKEVIRYVVRMTQDASHDSEQLALYLRKYIKGTNNTVLIRSICYAAIELIEWFVQYIKDHPNYEDNILNWNTK